MPADKPLRSRAWFDTPELYGWLRQAAFKAQGFGEAAYEGRPIIGICNSWSELTHCNSHLRLLAEAVKRGVWQAGGFPLEFPVMSLGEYNMRPITMLYRNLMSMDVEESITANPLDGVVLLAGCDKTTPAMLMGAASADVPAIVVTGGPQLKGNWRGEELGSCTDCRRYQQELRAGNITEDDWSDLQDCIVRSPGHCMTMGTASTMTSIAETLGLTLPGSASIPAVHAAHSRMAARCGERIVEMAWEDLKPSEILSVEAFDNAITADMAIGGSTNAIVHLTALARRAGIDLPLDRFDEISSRTPVLANIKPAGEHVMADFFDAGGLPALLHRIRDLLHLDCPTVAGITLGEAIEGAEVFNEDVIRPRENPLTAEGGTVVLRGNLAPDGAVIKPAAADPNLLTHSGPAIVFKDLADLHDRIHDPSLGITAEHVLVMKSGGPLGAPGMPESGMLPIPNYLLEQGVRDMVRLSDARMSGTSYGTCILHIAPESHLGGPLALVQDGDLIELDVARRRLHLDVSDKELAQRREAWTPPEPRFSRGYGKLCQDEVTQANEGCDFRFLENDGSTTPDPGIH
ncbi:MAG: IlvD/Edd family dehydratase [Roseibacillus sp.]